ncbi:MAG: hypothetical protein LUG26_00195 [Ruminococcus sp.]|nr:hypothetical protein [Ruminococcus sp.]
MKHSLFGKAFTERFKISCLENSRILADFPEIGINGILSYLVSYNRLCGDKSFV